jgi:hypothetical protein
MTTTTKIAYGASTAITITLASLASSSGFTGAREGTALTNSATLYDDVLVSGKITVGTSPSANTQIQVYVAAALDDTPTWPSSLTGADAAYTIASVGQGGFLRLGAVLNVDSASSNIAYAFAFPVAQLFGGVMPRDWTLVVTHNTSTALHATGGNHVIKYQGITFTNA